ncbi:MAG: ATP-binding protein [Anaerovoracaceae bacterium]
MTTTEQLINLSDLQGMRFNPRIMSMDEDQYQEWLCEQANKEKVKPNPEEPSLHEKYGIDCPFCGNKGRIVWWDRIKKQRSAYGCECLNTVHSLMRLDNSGIASNWRNKTFDSFHADTDWQKHMKIRVQRYADDEKRDWMLVTGQTGCGKTHLCTAAFVQLARCGFSCRYVRWLDIIQQLDAVYYKSNEYAELFEPLAKCRVLYLDDLFKTENKEKPTQRQFQQTFRLLDARYQNAGLMTIISTEWSLDMLVAYDEALGGRIKERCGNHIIQIREADGRNYRLKKE